MPPPVEAKMLARLYVAGRGYCFYRSAAMTDAEASQLVKDVFREGTGFEEDACNGATIRTVRCSLPHSQVYCRTHRVTDPDNPTRTALAVWLWLTEPSGAEASAVHSNSLMAALPTTEAEANTLGWLPLTPGRSLGEGDSAEASPRPPERPPGGLRCVLPCIAAAAAVAVAALAIVIIVWHAIQDRDGPGPPGPKPPVAPDPAWNDTKSLVRDRLRVVGERRVDNMSDVELIEGFVGLFRRPDIESLLDSEQRRSIERFKRSGEPHPFLAYLDCLPERVDVPIDRGKDGSWAELAASTLPRLAALMRAHGFEVAEGPPEQLVRDLRDNVLNYPAFFRSWKHRIQGGTDTVWCEEHRGGLYEWEPPVRELLRQKYKDYLNAH